MSQNVRLDVSYWRWTHPKLKMAMRFSFGIKPLENVDLQITIGDLRTKLWVYFRRYLAWEELKSRVTHLPDTVQAKLGWEILQFAEKQITTERWTEELCWLTLRVEEDDLIPRKEPLPWESTLADLSPIATLNGPIYQLYLADTFDLSYFKKDSTELADSPVTSKITELLEQHQEVANTISAQSRFNTPIPQLPLATIPPLTRTKRPYKRRQPREITKLMPSK